MAMQKAYVNIPEQAILFFDEYNIPYEVTKTGILKIKSLREKDFMNSLEAQRMLHNAGLDEINDHNNYFRDIADNTVVTFNPYHKPRIPEGITWLKTSEHNIYGMCTQTYVIIIPAK